ncbi:Ig-like domain-containing protein [soil metagenome]
MSHGRGLLALMSAVMIVTTGCTAGSMVRADDPAAVSVTESVEAGPAPEISVFPAADAKSVNPATRVAVDAWHGSLGEVSVTTADGQLLAGSIAADGLSWAAETELAYSSTYTVVATASGADGQETTTRSSFATVTPDALAFPAIGPLDGTTVGVGMPVRVYFDAPVTDRATAQQHLTVTATPAQEGAWSWFSDTEVHWRPKVYWQAGTEVTVTTSLFGVDLGGGTWGKLDREISFDVGPSHVSIANPDTHQMEVYADGVLVKTVPVSMGRAEGGWHTKSGPHVVLDKERKMTMDSTTYGLALDAGGYQTEVEFATRISNNGEFVHAAPWSVEDQGVRNVSHGCINLSPANAQWFFDFSQPGDVVDVVGTPVRLGRSDGDIYDWSLTWDQWLAGSALP